MSARLNIQIIQQQPLNTLLLSSHRAATVLLRQLSAGDLFLAAKWFRSCCNSSNALCATPAAALNSNGRPAVHCARTLHWWWWNCCCMQWRKVYTGLGFVGSTWAVSAAGGRSHCTFPASQPCSSTSPCSTSPPRSCCLLHMHHMDS